MLENLYLHIGMTKTGTSALQNFLMDNNDVLEKNDFCYLKFGVDFLEIGPHRNGHFLLYVTGEEMEEEYNACMGKLREAINEKKNIILSDEGIWYWQNIKKWWNAFKDWTKELGINIKFVVYLRKQEDWIESTWNQRIKGFRKRTETFDDFLKSDDFEKLPLNYEKSLSRLESLVGIDNLIVRSYDFKQFVNGNIYEDFLSILGLSMTDEYVIQERVANASMPLDAIEVKRMINCNSSYFNAKGVNFYNLVIADAYDDITVGYKKERETMFSDETLSMIRNKYKKGNEIVARKYLNRDDGVLFSSNTAYKKWYFDETKLLPESVKILSGADLFLYNQVQEMKSREKEMRNQIQELKKELAAQKQTIWQKIKRRLRS